MTTLLSNTVNSDIYDSDKLEMTAVYRAVVSSTDPAHSLHYTGVLLRMARSLMLRMLTDRIPDSTRILIAARYLVMKILDTMRNNGMEDDPDMERVLADTFRIEQTSVYGLELARDIDIVEELLEQWEYANSLYLERADAWGRSNTMLSKINVALFEIISRQRLKGAISGTSWVVENADTYKPANAAAALQSSDNYRTD